MSSSAPPERRLLLVHAHPDDETINTGAVMASYVAGGAQVTLLTCTLGEQGEILVPELAQLAAGQADQLGGYRVGELAGATRALGVQDVRFLRGAGHFRDSGMIGSPANSHPRAFWRGDAEPAVFEDAVAAAVDVIRDVRPHVVITYDTNGDYGHPDHIMANRVTTAALRAAADAAVVTDRPPWRTPKFYWTALPRSVIARGFDAIRASGEPAFQVADVDALGFGVADDEVTTVIDATGFGEAKLAALRAHRTQIAVDGPFFALSNMLGREVLAVEHFRLVEGERGGPLDERGREQDLFAGLDVAAIDAAAAGAGSR